MVDDVVTWPARPWRESLAGQLRCWRFARRLLRRARPAQGRFDLAVLPRRDAEHFGARYVAAAAADRVAAFDPADRLGPIGSIGQERERDLVSDLVCAGEPLTHVLRQGERLAAALGVTITPDAYDAPGLALIGPSDHAAARTLLSPLTAPAPATGPLVAVMLNSPHARGSWPGYAEAVNQVHQRLGIRVVLLGGPDDEQLGDDFIRTLNPSVPIVSAVGRAPLRTTLALLASSDLYLGGIGDAMHLACAVATPCVAVTCHPAGGNPADDDAPNRIGPWSADSRVVGPARPAAGCQDTCVSDVAHCITGVGTALVARTVADVLLGLTSRAVVPTAPQVPQQARHAEQAGFATA
nr:glycosyltransferase family 9 protein [Kineosporia mesophila]